MEAGTCAIVESARVFDKIAVMRRGLRCDPHLKRPVIDELAVELLKYEDAAKLQRYNMAFKSNLEKYKYYVKTANVCWPSAVEL